MKLNNLINIGFATLKSNLFGIDTPTNVMISVTNRCNSRCKYCDIPYRKQKEFTTKEITNLLDSVTKLGCQRISLWGGEPLMRKDIGQIIDYAKKRGLHVNLDTNGYLVHKKINEIKNLDLLVFSIDGPKEVHDKNREKGSYDKAIKGIKVAKKAGLKVWTITTLTKFNNKSSIDHILSLARKYKLLTTFQVMHHNVSLAGNKQTMYAVNEKYKDLIRKLISEKKKGAPIVTSLKFLRYLLKWEDYSINCSRKKVRFTKCFAGKLFCNVDTDGTVYPCVNKIGSFKGKNIRDVGFKKAFKYAKDNNCNSCTASGVMEFNFMHSFNIRVILNWLRFS